MGLAIFATGIFCGVFVSFVYVRVNRAAIFKRWQEEAERIDCDNWWKEGRPNPELILDDQPWHPDNDREGGSVV